MGCTMTFITFRKKLIFAVRNFSPSSNTHAAISTLVGCPQLIMNDNNNNNITFAATLHTWRLLFHPQLEVTFKYLCDSFENFVIFAYVSLAVVMTDITAHHL
jgi:hypothetical protein